MSIRVQFTEFGEPCGEGAVKLSSYLGPLVREHVPIMIDDWREIGEELKTVLWKSVKIRFELEGEYEKAAVMKQMGCLWRASKSRLVKEIRKAQNNVERMKLRPNNISTAEWRKFLKENTSQEFKAVSDSYKERRRKQIPHTCSRRGMVRLAEDLVSVLCEDLPEAPATTSPRTQSQVHTAAAPVKSSKPLSQSSSGFSQYSSQQDTSPKQIVKEDQKCS